MDINGGKILCLRRSKGTWPAIWRNLLRGLGCYDQHADAPREARRMLVEIELERFGGRLADVSTEEVVMCFASREQQVHFIMVWG